MGSIRIHELTEACPAPTLRRKRDILQSLESVAQLTGPAESLLLTLASRAFESAQKSPIVRDDKASELLRQLHYDARPISRSHLYHTIICLRTRRFDDVVASFLREHPGGTIVNLGCGLDTRYERVDNGQARWLEVDLPAVIELRRKLLPENERRRFHACSIDQLSPEVIEQFSSRPILFVAEGVLMFLAETDVHRLIMQLCAGFPGSKLVFDAVRPIEVWLRQYHPTLRRTGAAVRWGLTSAKALASAHPLRVTAEWYYCDEREPRLGWYRWLRFLPWLGRTAWILACDFDDAPRLPSRQFAALPPVRD
jgi:O-methyltransferase involved in polyketide biosynthesis